MKKQEAAIYNAAIYCRLSRDDETTGVSESIQNQRAMLTSYVKERDWNIHSVYIDDGWTGTNLERPDFKRMIQDIELGKVNVVVVKDLSRLGRNYVLTGELTEIYFPSKGVRFIAVNDNFDSENGNDDIAPFRHILNEMVARDTSRKVKSAFEQKKKDGVFIGAFAPYGYKKDPENKGRLIVDEQAAEIVRRMFYLASIGYGSRKIRNIYNGEGILAPAVYRSTQLTHIPTEKFTKSHEWSDQVVSDLLRSTVYLGHLSCGKSEKPSFKMKKIIQKPKEEWIVHYHAHEPIVDQELWDNVQRQLTMRTRTAVNENIFARIAVCADCGYAMQYHHKAEKSLTSLACSGYSRYGKDYCSNHLVNYDLLHDMVLEQIRKHARLAVDEQDALAQTLMDRMGNADSRQFSEIAEELERAEKRNTELDILFMRIYEDSITGAISKERYHKMSSAYECEQSELKEKVYNLRAEMAAYRDTSENHEHWLRLIQKYADIEELDKAILHELVERIEIGQGTYEYNGCRAQRKKHQEITIYYRFVGNI